MAVELIEHQRSDPDRQAAESARRCSSRRGSEPDASPLAGSASLFQESSGQPLALVLDRSTGVVLAVGRLLVSVPCARNQQALDDCRNA